MASPAPLSQQPAQSVHRVEFWCMGGAAVSLRERREGTVSTLEHPEQPAQLYRNIINETTLWAQIGFHFQMEGVALGGLGPWILGRLSF